MRALEGEERETETKEMIKRADSVVKRAGGGQGHVGGGGRHRRLASARHKHTRVSGRDIEKRQGRFACL